MGETKQASIGTLTKGNYIVIDGAACRVTGTQTSRPGKHGHAKVRLEANGLIDGKKRMILIEKCGEIEFRMTEGSDEFIQLEALLAQVSLEGSK